MKKFGKIYTRCEATDELIIRTTENDAPAMDVDSTFFIVNDQDEKGKDSGDADVTLTKLIQVKLLLNEGGSDRTKLCGADELEDLTSSSSEDEDSDEFDTIVDKDQDIIIVPKNNNIGKWKKRRMNQNDNLENYFNFRLGFDIYEDFRGNCTPSIHRTLSSPTPTKQILLPPPPPPPPSPKMNENQSDDNNN
ncbi:hypothetical protein SNEBB_010729 [Seison nebaliae]|nr:hypothetical protein SNEBB_010729 [Seison nebaliae]